MIPMAIMMITKEDDKEFITRLFLQNELIMYATAYRVVKNYYIAADMVSEACVTMIRKIENLRRVEPEKQSFYIAAIVRNTSLMYLRRKKREKILLIEGFKRDEEMRQDVDSKLISEAETQILHTALARIHKRDRELLEMKYFERIPDEEIGQRMGIGAASVRFYLTKARRNLAVELKKEDDI